MENKFSCSSLSLFKIIRLKSKIISVLTLLAFLNLSVSCSYYKSKTLPSDPNNFAKNYESVKHLEKRYVIIHSDNEVYHLSNVTINDNKKEISGNLEIVDASHLLYPLKEGHTSARFNGHKSKKTIEIHLYTNQKLVSSENAIDILPKPISIPFSDITKAIVYDRNQHREALNVVAITFGVLAIIGIYMAATKSSCPFVYIKDGESYTFSGELYPGAILPTLERTDYLPLPNFNLQNEEYELKITNELLEIQNTDLAQLVVINHSADIDVLLDQNGNQHTISKKLAPEEVIIDGFTSDLKPALKKDSISYLFDRENKPEKIWNDVVLKFDNTNQSKKAKLILSAKNSYWLDLVYGKFNEQFGSYFNQFQKSQRKVPAEKNIQWRNNQGIPLSVYVKSNNEWVLVEKINPVGPMAFRDLVIPIDLKNITTKKLEVKLECGFMFWEVDYVAIDFSTDIPLDANYISPYSAIDEKGNNVTNLLDKEDGKRLVQPNIGNEVVLKYHSESAKKGEKQSVFLKNKGYYEYIRNYNGIPNFAKLKTFKEVGAISNYSKEEYKKFTAVENLNDIVFGHE